MKNQSPDPDARGVSFFVSKVNLKLLVTALLLALIAGKVEAGTVAGKNKTAGSHKVKKATTNVPQIAYASPQTYTAGVAITTLSPTNSGGTVAQPGYNDANDTKYTAFVNPYGVASDMVGNLYVADNGAGNVYMMPAGSNTPELIAQGLINPAGIAVDASGDVFVAVAGQHEIIKISNGTTSVVGTGFTNPVGVALDAAGDIYVADNSARAVYKIPVGGGSNVTIATGFGNPQTMAIDPAGNIYVADASIGLEEIPANSSSFVQVAPSLNDPAGVCINATGDLFVTNSSSVYEIAAGTTSPVMIGAFVNSAYGVTTDGFGNVYMTDNGNNVLYEISPTGGFFLANALPAGLSFSKSTGAISGTPTAAANTATYLVTAWNSTGYGQTTLTITVNPSPPTLSYAGPKTYTAGTAITLSPTSTQVAAPAYGSANTFQSGLHSPLGVTVDVAGDVYIVDSDSQIKEFPAGGGAEQFLGSGLSEPYGIWVDAAGNLYIADTGNNAIKKIAAGQTVPVTIGYSFSQPSLAVADAAGNVYVADRGNNAVKEILAGSGNVLGIGSGFSSPSAVAVDNAGNVFVADQGNSAVKEIPAQGGPVITVATGIGAFGLTKDPTGNIFVSDYGANMVLEIPVSGGTPIALGSGFSDPGSVAVDSKGNIYIADSGNNAIKEIAPLGGYYLNTPLPLGLSLNNSTGVISGTPLVASPAANYVVTAYNSVGNVSATINIKTILPTLPTVHYTTPQSYLKGAAITALSPTSTAVAALAYSTTPVVARSGFSGPNGVAVDAAGNVYIADSGNGKVKKLSADHTTIVSIGSGFSYPNAVAVDTAGNVYVADKGNFTVKKISANGSATVTLGSGYSSPDGVAVDAAGNVYVADIGATTIQKIPAVGGSPTTVGSGLTGPDEVACDASGNLYVVDNSGNVYKIAAGTGTTTLITGGYTFGGVAVDASGNVFFSDVNQNFVKEIPAGSTDPVTIGSGFKYPEGLAVDGAGNVYEADVLTSTIREIKPIGGYYINTTLPAGLSFNNNTGAISGTPTSVSAATNYTVTGYNLGGGVSSAVNIKVYTTNAALSALAISNGTLSPAFATATTSYSTSVGYNLQTMTVTPTAADPSATIKVNGTLVASGTASPHLSLTPGANTVNIVVTASDGTTTKTYTLVVNEAHSSNNNLAGLTISSGALSPVFAAATTAYTANVAYAVPSITITPTTADGTATVKVNGSTVASGAGSPSIPLIVGSNTITILVTAGNAATKTYTITVTRLAASTNSNLSGLTPSRGTLTPAFVSTTLNYTDMVTNGTSSVTITPTTQVTLSTVTVNGVAVLSGHASGAILLAVGSNVVPVVVTAQDGSTTKTYTVNVIRPSTNAKLSAFTISSGTLSPVFNTNTTTYTASVTNATATIKVTPTVTVTGATVKVNGAAVTSGNPSGAIALSVGANTITTVVTAQDGVTTDTYTLTVTRAAAGENTPDASIGVGVQNFEPLLANGGINVHQGLSPNGDGINDFLQIDNITNYPDNNLKIITRNGLLIFEMKGYDNGTKVFDGHSNKTGQMQLPGTYFYSLDYTVKGILKHKTGFLVLKY